MLGLHETLCAKHMPGGNVALDKNSVHGEEEKTTDHEAVSLTEILGLHGTKKHVHTSHVTLCHDVGVCQRSTLRKHVLMNLL